MKFSGREKKMLFVSIWFSFAVALYILNSQKRRKTYSFIPDFNSSKALILIAIGFVGGNNFNSFLLQSILLHLNLRSDVHRTSSGQKQRMKQIANRSQVFS